MEKKQKSFFVFIAILIGIGIGVLAWIIFTPSLAKGIFYYHVQGNEAKLFLITSKNQGEEIISFPAREIDLGKYRTPRRSYISNTGKQMIYFETIEEKVIEDIPEEGVAITREIYKPMLVNLKTRNKTEINQPIDSSSLVFSPSDTEIAWVKEVEEITFQGIEQSGKKRELWISRADGENAELLKSFDENVILVQRWDNNYIYFQGLWDTTIRSLGRINTKTRKVDYLVPRYCEKFLENCQNIEFSISGNYFLYEIYKKTEDNEVTELYLGNFDEREFLEVLTTDRISDRLWFTNEKSFLYTEQEMVRKEGGGGEKEVRETIHLVNLRDQTDDEIYAGSYISQLTIDPNGKYLYFLERERGGERFNLIRLDIKTKKTETILTENYNHILLIQ